MSFLLTLVALLAAGSAVLRLLRLATARPLVDVPLAWLVGSGWFGLVTAVLRFGAGVPYSRAVALGTVLLPVVAWGAVELASRRRDRAAGAPAEPLAASAPEAPVRWLPRPWWVFAPLAAYVVFVTVVTLLQGFGTPTSTDDGVRVRAFTPLLAFADEWGPAARELFSMAGAIPTFVPSLAWRLTGSVDPFHPNYVVLADFLAFLALTVAVPTFRGAPERGWAGAFAVLSLPLFVYHCTTTYQDAVLAMFVAVGFLWSIEYARTRDGADAGRALLVLAAAFLVKREGRLVAGAAALPVVAHFLWERRRGVRWRSPAMVAAGVAAVLLVTAAAAGPGSALPFLAEALERLGGTDAGDVLPASLVRAAFFRALFHSGNAGMLYWVLPAALLLRPRVVAGRAFWLPLAGAGLVFALAAASSLWMFPRFTVDQTTVHRALIAASLLLSLWVAGVIVEPAMAVPVPELARPRPEATRRKKKR